MYYLQSRYYDPSTGRFINADAFTSTGQGLLGNNMFAYCNNNAANNVDVNGCMPSGGLEICNPDEIKNLIAPDAGGSGSFSIDASSVGSGIVIGGSIALSILWNKYSSETLSYSRSLVDSFSSQYANHQPRIHHVIPRGDFSKYGESTVSQLQYMHELLKSINMNINHPENLIIISHGTHKSMHTKAYINSIYNIMKWAEAGDEWSVRAALFLARQYAASLDQYPMSY